MCECSGSNPVVALVSVVVVVIVVVVVVVLLLLLSYDVLGICQAHEMRMQTCRELFNVLEQWVQFRRCCCSYNSIHSSSSSSSSKVERALPTVPNRGFSNCAFSEI
jgi:nitrate/nitrite-specific signal transduction histidine kinase